MRRKRIRYAASTYGINLPDLKKVGEDILREGIGEEVELRWMTKEHKGGGEVRVSGFDEARAEEYQYSTEIQEPTWPLKMCKIASCSCFSLRRNTSLHPTPCIICFMKITLGVQ